MKKWYAAFIASGMILTIGATEASAKTSADFSDLRDLDAATKAKFDAMIQAGIFDGVSDSSFGLQENMNRAQFAKVAALIFGLNVDSDIQTSSFSDVKADDAANGWAVPYIEAAKKAGLINGVGDGEFNPSGTVTKEQLATVLVRGLGVNSESDSGSQFQDNTVSDWAKDYVAEAVKLKLLPTGEDGTFGGNAIAKRDDLVIGAYETKAQTDTGPKVSGVTLDSGTDLTLKFENAIDPKSVKLENIKVGGIALNPDVDTFTVSEDGKTLSIKLHSVVTSVGVTPTVTIEGVQSTFGKKIEENAATVPVQVTNPPSTPVNYTPVVVVPAQVATPTASPAGGAVASGTTVTLSSATPDATIYYTTDGSAPSASNGTAYSAPIAITGDVTIKAVAVKSGMTDSAALSESYTVMAQVATPTASPVSGAVASGTTVALSSATPDATIYYTTDGSAPSASDGTAYSAPIAITSDVTIKAVAVKSGMTDSAALSESYTVMAQVATPTASPVSGAVASGTTVALSSATPDATIYYTTDGSAPSASDGTAYSAPIAITSDVTIKAVAVKSGMTDSAALSESYTVMAQVATPTASPVSGAVASGTTVTLSSATPDATIYYTTDGSAPSASNGTAYSAPIAITGDVTIKAVAVKSGMTDSAALSESYTVMAQVATPTASPVSGAVASGTTVTLSSGTPDATIYYTTDGSAPSASNGTAYSAPIAITSDVTIKAVAVKAGMTASAALSESYTVMAQAETPTASAASGEVAYGTFVTLSAEDGATIRYTLNGSDPTADNNNINSFTYFTPFYVVNDMTIRAVAFKNGVAESNVLALTYTIDPASRPLSVTGLEYLGESDVYSLLKVTFSGAVDSESANEAFHYMIVVGQMGMEMPTVYTAERGGAGHENEVTLKIDSLAGESPGTYVSVTVDDVKSEDLSKTVPSGENHADFDMP